VLVDSYPVSGQAVSGQAVSGQAVSSLEAGSPELRLVDATLRCISRWGVAKTTLDDVAREAGCSRATVYRIVPGGKDGLMALVARVEVGRFFAGIAGRLETADDLESLVVLGMAEAGRRIRDHAALRYLLTHEPEQIVPRLAFSHLDEVLTAASEFVEPWLARWLPEPGEAARAAEWITRLVLSYSICPADGMDIGDEQSVRGLVRTYVLPGLTASIQP
jgi:AcrR family transcriptional regulator